MIESILSNDEARLVLQNGAPEVCGYWRDPETGIRCRMQADFIAFDGKVLIDIKTTQDCDPLLFRKTLEAQNYQFQMAMYAEGIKQITGRRPSKVAWIAVENKAPFETRVYEWSPVYEFIGDSQFRDSILKLKQCIEKNEFPGGQSSTEIIEPSGVLLRKYEQLLVNYVG